MVTIQIDDQTAQLLESHARQTGLSVSDYLRGLISPETTKNRIGWDDLEDKILTLSTDEPSLPTDFSRSDIYHDHI